jgi:hypothetical protein
MHYAYCTVLYTTLECVLHFTVYTEYNSRLRTTYTILCVLCTMIDCLLCCSEYTRTVYDTGLIYGSVLYCSVYICTVQ